MNIWNERLANGIWWDVDRHHPSRPEFRRARVAYTQSSVHAKVTGEKCVARD